MKRTTLLVSSLALLSFTQQAYGITLDQDEVTVIIEGSADTPQPSHTFEPIPTISEVLTKQEATLFPDKPIHNKNKVSPLPVPFEVDPTIRPPIKDDQLKPAVEEKQTILSDFPTGDVIILNQDEEWLSDSDSTQHSYLGNWMGVTSQSINR